MLGGPVSHGNAAIANSTSIDRRSLSPSPNNLEVSVGNHMVKVHRSKVSPAKDVTLHVRIGEPFDDTCKYAKEAAQTGAKVMASFQKPDGTT